MKHSVRWLIALALLGVVLLGKLCMPLGIEAVQQTVFGYNCSAIESAVDVFARGGSAEEAVACFAAD